MRIRKFIATAFLLLSTGLGCANPHELSCEQRRSCLITTGKCQECEAENFMEVCLAKRKVQLAGIDSCDSEDCRRAIDLAQDYDACLADQSCEAWQEGFNSSAFRVIGLCGSLAREFSDALEECRTEKSETCILQPWSSRRF